MRTLNLQFLLVGVVISVLLSLISSLALPAAAQFGFIVALLGTAITLLFENLVKLDHAVDCSKKSLDTWLSVVNSQSKVLGKDTPLIFQRLVANYFIEFRKNLETLSNGTLLCNDLFISGASAIENARNDIVAVEAGSNLEKWENKREFHTYHSIATKAIHNRRIDFTRIWVINRDPADFVNLWTEHSSHGIHTRWVDEANLNPSLKSPRFLDFAIIDSTILVRSNVIDVGGNGWKYDGGCITINPDDVNDAIKRYKLLYDLSIPFQLPAEAS
jgi:hypothetical protein